MRWSRLTALVIWACAIWLPPSLSLASSSCPSAYTVHFIAASYRHLPTTTRLYGYEMLRAQAWQESRCRPAAISPAGAEGVMQFMPATWREAQQALGHGAHPSNARASIYSGAWYMARMRSVWTAPRPEWDRYRLALASYNAGAGNIIRAQRACGGPNDYAGIMACLPQITGHHSAETLDYVPRIIGYWEQMRLGRL